MRPYNVLFISRYSPDYAGNFIPSIAKLGSSLSVRNDVFYLFPEQARGKAWVSLLPVPDDHILFCDFAPKPFFKFLRDVKRRLGDRPIIVHSHFMGGLTQTAMNLVFRNRINHYHMFVPEVNEHSEKLRRAFVRFNNRGSVVICVSSTLTSLLKAYLPASIVECVPNAVDYEHLSALSENAPRLEFLNDDSFNILIHGSHFYWKGVDLAAKAVERLNANGHRCDLYITSGDVPFTEGLLGPHIAHPEYFHVIRGVQEVKNLYDNVDLMLSCSRYDAFAYSIVEASYSDCQVVATDIPGPSMLKDIPGVRWIESENVAALEQAVLEAMEAKNSGTADAVKPRQRAYVMEHYSIDVWAQRVLSLYQKYYDIEI